MDDPLNRWTTPFTYPPFSFSCSLPDLVFLVIRARQRGSSTAGRGGMTFNTLTFLQAMSASRATRSRTKSLKDSSPDSRATPKYYCNLPTQLKILRLEKIQVKSISIAIIIPKVVVISLCGLILKMQPLSNIAMVKQ